MVHIVYLPDNFQLACDFGTLWSSNKYICQMSQYNVNINVDFFNVTYIMAVHGPVAL